MFSAEVRSSEQEIARTGENNLLEIGMSGDNKVCDVTATSKTYQDTATLRFSGSELPKLAKTLREAADYIDSIEKEKIEMISVTVRKRELAETQRDIDKALENGNFKPLLDRIDRLTRTSIEDYESSILSDREKCFASYTECNLQSIKMLVTAILILKGAE